jgi:hypothetical protein
MSQTTEFEKAARQKPLSLPGQFVIFLAENKKWWLLPIVMVLGLLGLLSLVASTGAAPFIYTMF